MPKINIQKIKDISAISPEAIRNRRSDFEEVAKKPAGFFENIQKIKSEKPLKELLEFSIINLDKSSGPTSFTVSTFVKKTLGLKKTAHFGTLDPKVTGVLPIGLNRACKLTGFFLGEDKTYVGIMRVHKEISLKEIDKKIKEKFMGEILQTPPLKSRVKRQERPRTIYEFKLLEKNGLDVLFNVKCQGGTYIRKLIDDLGKELNIGAHMLELRRTNAGIFSEDKKKIINDKSKLLTNLEVREKGRNKGGSSKQSGDDDSGNNNLLQNSVNLYDFEKAVEEYKNGDEKLLREILIPGEIVSKLHPAIQVKKTSIKKLHTGKPLLAEDILEKDKVVLDLTKTRKELITAFSKNQFIGIYKLENVDARRDEVFARGEYVMQPVKE